MTAAPKPTPLPEPGPLRDLDAAGALAAHSQQARAVHAAYAAVVKSALNEARTLAAIEPSCDDAAAFLVSLARFAAGEGVVRLAACGRRRK